MGRLYDLAEGGGATSQRRAFIERFVEEVPVRPGIATVHYTIPTPGGHDIGGADIAETALSRRVMRSVTRGGRSRDRTCGLLCVRQAL